MPRKTDSKDSRPRLRLVTEDVKPADGATPGRGRGRPAKTLLDLVDAQSFRARRERHRELLESSPDLPWRQLAGIQRRYRRSTREDTRRRIASEFERVVQEGHATEPERPLGEILEELGPRGSAERYINFFPRFFRHTKGPRAGEAFALDDYQIEFMLEFHRLRPDGSRVYQRGYLVIPGGNGKTPLAAGHGVIGLAELDDAPEIYCVAGAKGQAGIAQAFASTFVKGTEADPGELQQWLRANASGSRISNPATGGVMEVLPTSGGLQEGKQPSIVIFDELWAFERQVQEDTYVALSGKLHKRDDAYMLGISTAGRGSKNLLLRIIKAQLKRPAAEIERRGYLTIVRNEEHGTLLWMWQAPADAPLEDIGVIRAVNPAPWLDPKVIVKQLHDEGVGESEFRRLARNEWVAVKNQWLPPGVWDAIARPPKRRKPPAPGTTVVLAFDGSYNNDSTALVGWVPEEDYGFVVEAWERPDDDEHWIVPRDDVNATVEWAMREWKVLELACDPPGWYEEIEKWSRLYGDTVTLMFATNHVATMIDACSEFYSAVVQSARGNGKTSHDGDPRAAKHLANAFTREVGRKAYIVKEYRDSPNKIDIAVAFVMARYRALRARPKKRGKVVAW